MARGRLRQIKVGRHQTCKPCHDDREVSMGLEDADAGARQAGRLGDVGAEASELEQAASGEADGWMHGMVLGCSGCAEAGHCRRGLDPEQLASACMGPVAPAEAW